jgi:hypothetical protein
MCDFYKNYIALTQLAAGGRVAVAPRTRAHARITRAHTIEHDTTLRCAAFC